MDKVGLTVYICNEIGLVCRMLIDIATGVDTCADRVDLHDDGEERTKLKRNLILILLQKAV